MNAQQYGPPPGYHIAEPVKVRQQFQSTLGNDAEIDPQEIATAVRAVMNGVLVIEQTVFKLERQPVTAADILLKRVVGTIDFGALDRAQEGVARLERLLGPEGLVLFEGGDHAVSALRAQVDAAAATLAPYQKLRGRTP
jgi:hypothetical protein